MKVGEEQPDREGQELLNKIKKKNFSSIYKDARARDLQALILQVFNSAEINPERLSRT